jgi:hypothetical protein
MARRTEIALGACRQVFEVGQRLDADVQTVGRNYEINRLGRSSVLAE